MENVIQTCLAMIVKYHRVSLNGLVENMGRCLRVFYAGDGMVGSRDSDWLQHSMNIFIVLFRSYGLVANVSKSCTMICQPGALRSGILEEAK